MDGFISNVTARAHADLAGRAGQLEALNPLSVLARGYGVVSDAEGRAIRSVHAVKEKENLSVRVSDGTILATVISKSEGES